MDLVTFYKGKRVLITGHTGFKGSWLAKILIDAGAKVCGYSLEPTDVVNIFSIIKLEERMHSEIADIRDLNNFKRVISDFSPEIIFHLAAQPLVRESYIDPVYTYETNIMGTVNVLEAIRTSTSVKSVVIVTTDKVYFNNEWEWGYRESDKLNGFDPYSNSKSCVELITSSYVNSFFQETDIRISTARAGNVIGGGDFSKDRIIPDCIKAAVIGKTINIRNPFSTRPYQHVLEPLFGYLLIAKKQVEDKLNANSYNIGPNDDDCVSTGNLVDTFCRIWGEQSWEHVSAEFAPHEAKFLKLDCSRIKNVLSWQPVMNIYDAVSLTVQWHKAYMSGNNMDKIMGEQIVEYMKLLKY